MIETENGIQIKISWKELLATQNKFIVYVCLFPLVIEISVLFHLKIRSFFKVKKRYVSDLRRLKKKNANRLKLSFHWWIMFNLIIVSKEYLR